MSKKDQFLDEYKSKKKPVTAYAKSKMMSEKYLSKIKDIKNDKIKNSLIELNNLIKKK